MLIYCMRQQLLSLITTQQPVLTVLCTVILHLLFPNYIKISLTFDMKFDLAAMRIKHLKTSFLHSVILKSFTGYLFVIVRATSQRGNTWRCICFLIILNGILALLTLA